MARHIIFVSTTCSNTEFEKVQQIKHREKLNPSQKFYDMLICGLSQLDDCKVHCITARPIAHSNCNLKHLPYKKECVGEQLEYTYLKVNNKPVVRNICNVIEAFSTVKKLINSLPLSDEIVLLCDPLAYDISFGALLSTKRKGTRKVAIVTDLPYYMTKINKSRDKRFIKRYVSVFRRYFIDKMLMMFDMYCFLTDSMNKVNKKNKPYFVMEGMIPAFEDRIQDNNVDNNTVVYAGGLFEQFGIKTLVDAAVRINIPGFSLQLYGEGASVEYINQVNETHPNIKYMGVAKLDEIYQIEKQAKLLINPRPSNQEFTEYSFPSKTLEYMSAARPVLSTRLKGIPMEYFNYLLPIEDETEEGIVNAIETVLEQPTVELNEIGMKNYRFVCEHKNNIKQAQYVAKYIFK